MKVGGNGAFVTVTLGMLSERPWPGALSARSYRFDLPSLIDELDDYYVPADPRGKTRCIDGRHNPDDEEHLGPQVPAGALGSALAYRLGVDRDDLTRGTFVNDADIMIDSYIRLDISPGGHRDNTERTAGVGCGAIDGVAAVLERLIDPASVDDVKRLTRALLADDFDRDTYLRVMGAALMLQSRAESYFAGTHRILELLEERAPGSVTTLEGQHAEALVVVNSVVGTTLSSNRFAEHHGGHQAFGYDLWRSKQLALSLFPLPSQDLDRERFVMARVMITMATLMTLTDGTLPLIVRVPIEDDRAEPRRAMRRRGRGRNRLS